MFKGLAILLSFLTIVFSDKFECMDESNKPVDWFVMYKLPKIKDSDVENVQDGLGYAFITSEGKKTWTLSKRTLEDTDSVPGNTLDPLYGGGKSKDILYFMYNDQPPNKNTKSTGGHAKGVVVAGDKGGFWLIHSVPKFAAPPSGKKKYSFPDSGHNNGQSFLCITLGPKDLEIVGEQLKFNEVNVFADNIPSDLAKKYPNLADVADGEKEKDETSSVQNIKSVDGVTFRVFAKSSKWRKELYSDLVAPDLKTDLVVQTWPNSRSHQKSTCSKKNYNVENIEETNICGVIFTSTKDHSKWAASSSPSKPYVCIGDINKDDSQAKRGGGTVCIKDKGLWKAYYDSTEDLQSCGGGKKRKGKDRLGANPMDIYAPFWHEDFWKNLNDERNTGNQPLSRFNDIIAPIG